MLMLQTLKTIVVWNVILLIICIIVRDVNAIILTIFIATVISVCIYIFNKQIIVAPVSIAEFEPMID